MNVLTINYEMHGLQKIQRIKKGILHHKGWQVYQKGSDTKDGRMVKAK